MSKLLSIITINKDNYEGLKNTLASVFAQDCDDFEYLVIDGASTDGSKALIEANQEKIDYWISEQDHGIFAAMNKGIYKAKGKYLLFLNSGDVLTEVNILSKLAVTLQNQDADFFYTNAWYVNTQEQKVKLSSYPNPLPKDYFIAKSLCHQSTLIKRTLFDELGKYDEHYRMISDWAFFYEAMERQKRFEYIPNFQLVYFAEGGFSSDYRISIEERRTYISQNHPQYLEAYERSQQPIKLSTRAVNRVSKELFLLRNNKIHQSAYRDYQKKMAVFRTTLVPICLAEHSETTHRRGGSFFILDDKEANNQGLAPFLGLASPKFSPKAEGVTSTLTESPLTAFYDNKQGVIVANFDGLFRRHGARLGSRKLEVESAVKQKA